MRALIFVSFRLGLLTAALSSIACSSDSVGASAATRPAQSAAAGVPAMVSASPSTAGLAGQAASPPSLIVAAAPLPPSAAQPVAMKDCRPGMYKGSYNCEVLYNGFPTEVEGEVVFKLESNRTSVQQCMPGAEFCEDLVISKDSGTLQGQAMLILGFETMLDGALDCSRSEFRAKAVGGRWGLPVSVDPNNPAGAWKVDEPPFGTFDGELTGKHSVSAGTQTIDGTWSLHEMSAGVDCNGPFSVTLQP